MQQVEIDRPELEKEISDFLAQSFLELDEGERQLMKQFGLTITQYWALVHLEREEGRSLSELADLLICDKSNVTAIVDKFEKSGLAERKRGKAGDRRYIRVVLTPQGQQLRAIMMDAREHLQQLREPLQQLAHVLQTQFKQNEVHAMVENSVEQVRARPEASAVFSSISLDAAIQFVK